MTKTFVLFPVIVLFLVALLLLSAMPATMPTSKPVDEDSLWATSIDLDCKKAEGATGYVLGYQVRGHGNVTARPHATQKHGTDIYKVRQELSRRGPDRKQDCPPSDRVIMAIEVAGKWFVSIYGRTSHLELTCFQVRTKDFGRRWRKLLEMNECFDDGNSRRAW